jgi:uncharacterized protein (TIGR03083 family)
MLTRASDLSATSRHYAAIVTGEQVKAYVSELRSLNKEDWSRPTDCPGWDVRRMAAHVTGALDEGAHFLVMLRHLQIAKQRAAGTPLVDALNDAQIAD